MATDTVTSILREPIVVNKLRIANRMVLGPMAAIAPNTDGTASEQTVAFFERRARGGVGMIIVGGTCSTARSVAEAPVKTVLRLDTDATLDSIKRVTAAAHAHGVPIIAELTASFGAMAVPGHGRPNISASPIGVVIPEARFPKGMIVPGGKATPVPQEAKVQEIQQLEREVIESAMRAQRAGFDGAEVAAHMSYLAASFLSPRTNKRTDDYGGSVENRARMVFNIVAGIRQQAGPDFVIGLRLPANDLMPEGQGASGFAAVAKRVEAAGLDYVALSYGCYETMDASAPAADGGMIDSGDARLFKQALSVPILFQGVHDPEGAARAISAGHGDLVMWARPMLADPDLPRKVTEGRLPDIVRCRRDNHCMRRMVFKMPVRCEVNPEMGRESRAAGGLPPLDRILKRPVESLVLGLTGSPGVMKFLGSLKKSG
jgi:dimethylglycine catabolism A